MIHSTVIRRVFCRVRHIAAILALIPLAITPPYVMANPTGGQVAAGRVNFAGGAGQLDLTQLSQAAIVNWRDFSIKAGEIVNIHQNGPDAALLNRVLGANPSALLGQLHANGRVFLINPNGIVVGKGASINAMEFIASALDVADRDFLNGGDLAFQGDSTAGVVNLGTITAANGDAILIAYKVANHGEINAPEGVAALAAGNDVMLSPEGDQRVFVKTTLPGASALSREGEGTGVDNSGIITAAQAELKAAGGSVYGLAINQTGYVRATGVSRKDGRILLTAEDAHLQMDGTLAAHNANGSGGEILVGGDYRGKNNAIANAAHTTVGADAVIDVRALSAHADGGRAIVWADQQTDFAGKIEGRGGALGGDGAFAEVSGKHILNYSGLADLSAANGATGTLLLDPDQAIISTAADDQANGAFNNGVISTNLGTANVVVDASTFGNRDYSVEKSGEIIVNAPITWTSGNTLTLKSGNSITVNADLAGTGGDIVFQAMGVTRGASVTSDAAATITADSLTIKQNPDSIFAGYNPEPARYRSINDILLSGVVNVGTLDILTENAGIDGDILIANAANNIGTLKSSATSGTINGAINFADGSGGLIVSGDFSNRAETTVVTRGDLTLASGAKLGSGPSQNIVLAAQGGSFINNAGDSVLSVGTGGRFLIYSDNPADTTLGGLTTAPVYNKTYAANAPGTITQTGNRVLYSLAAKLTFAADNLSRLYGSANPALTYTVTGLVGGDTAGQVYSGTPTPATTAQTTDDAGTKPITIAANTVTASDYDYQIAFAPGTLTINPAPLTITADNLAKTEGNANPTLTATFSGLVNGDTASDITGLALSTAADVSSIPGTYAITASGAVNANYAITFVNGVLTINGIPTLVVTADDFAILYGAALPAFTSSISGFNGSDDASIVSGLTLTSTAAVGSPVGTYDIVPSGATAAGYVMNFVNGKLTINPAALTITANDASRAYGSANPTFGVSYTGFVNGETSSVVSGLTVATTATDSSGVGTYAITPSGATAANYTITQTPGTLTVDRAPLTLDVANLSKVYADPNPTLTATATGLVLGQTLATVGTLSLTTPVVQLSDVGTYDITGGLTGPLLNNYDLTINQGRLTITQRPATVEIGGGTREYGEANPTITVAVRGDDPAGMPNFILNHVNRGTTNTTATASSDVGTYATTITDMTASNPNFAISVVEGELVITAAPLTIKANNASRLYGAANPAFTSTNTGLKLTDTIADVVGSPTITTPATVTSNVGSYAITPSGNVLTANYDVIFKTGTLTVNKAPLFIVPALSSRLYGDPDPAFTISATGLLNGDTADVVKQEQFSGSHPTWGVGSHPITILGATATNYALTFGAGTMNVLPRPLTITAGDFTREYGEPNPTFTFTFSNLASFDDPSDIPGVTISSPPDATANVLSTGYALNPTSGTNPNYTISYAPGRLTITPAPLRIDLGSVTREYGDANPAPSVSVATGLKNSETVSVLGLQISTTAVPTSNIGGYPYLATSANPNYALTVNGGFISVTPAPLAVSLDDVRRHYGDANPTTYTGRLGGLKFAAPFESIVTVTDPTFVDTDVGTYALGAYLNTDNYTLTGVTGDVIISPRPLTLNFSGLSRVYGDANPSEAIMFNALDYAGVFAPGDQPLDVIRISTPAKQNSDVGSYPIQVGVLDPNYLGSPTVNGSLTVTARPLDVYINPIARVYGQANPASYHGLRAIGYANDLTPFDSLDDVLAITAPAITADIGTYHLSAALRSSNYILKSFEGLMDINRRPISVRLPDSVHRVYGEPNPAIPDPIVLTPSSVPNAGVAPFDTIKDVVSYNLPGITAPVTFYSLGASLNNNYDVSVATNDSRIFVDPRPIHVAITPSYSRVYGEPDPTGLVSVVPTSAPASGLASFDTIADAITVAGPGQRQGVGSYALYHGVTSSNYAVTIDSGRDSTATITPRPLNIIADDFTRVYGDDNGRERVNDLLDAHGEPQGIASFDTEADVLTRTYPAIDAAVGVYSLIKSTNNPNYDYEIFRGTGTVTARPLTVTLPGFTRIYGEANPAVDPFAITGTLPGFQTESDVIRLRATPDITTPVGVYPVAEYLNPNYDFTFAGESDYTINRRIMYLRVANSIRNYGDPLTPLNTTLLFGNTSDFNLTSFETLDDVVQFNRPAQDADVGRYNLTIADNPNYEFALSGVTEGVEPYEQILARPVTVEFFGETRLYGVPNARANADYVHITNLAPHDTRDAILAPAVYPGTRSNAGTYSLGVSTDNANYVYDISGNADITVLQRTISFKQIYRTYGEKTLQFSAPGGDGPASFDTYGGLFKPLLLTEDDPRDRKLPAGYYPLANFGLADETNYRLSSTPSAVFTVLPRVVTLDIGNQSLNFDTADELSAYFANENLVLAATASNLAPGETFDDAFPIIRYQLVDTNSVPTLPVIPTINNVVLPEASTLISNPATIGKGVTVSGAATGAGTLPRAGVGTLTDAGIVLNKFATVFDGFDTEENYVLGGVANGRVRLNLKPTVVAGSNEILADGSGFSIGNITLSVDPKMEAALKAAEAQGTLTIGSALKPPGLQEFFTAGNVDFGVDMISSYLQESLTPGLLYNFEAGGLLAEITRSEDGTVADLTPFRIRRWLERNADNPAAMGLLAEPLANYTKKFLNKDPATYTDSEAQFSRVLAGQMTKARNDFADRVEARRDEWVSKKMAAGNNMADLLGSDVPYKDFFTEGAAEYVSDGIEAKIALTAGATAVGAATTGAVMAGLTGAVLPYAVTTAVATGGTTFGGSIAAGASVASAGAAAVVAVPVMIVAGAIVGSIARGIQVFETKKQEGVYNDLVGGKGPVDPGNFALTTDSGKDDVINQTILLGALAGMLYPESNQ